MTTKEKYKSLIDECLEDECHCEKWCILKEILVISQKYDPRLLVQTKVVEIFKWEESKKAGGDIGWGKAWELWVTSGLAEKFAKVYIENPEMSPKKIYHLCHKE